MKKRIRFIDEFVQGDLELHLTLLRIANHVEETKPKKAKKKKRYPNRKWYNR